MTSPANDDDTPIPGTVFTPRGVRVLKIAVIVMGVLLVGGFVAVLAAIVYKAGQLGEGEETASPPPAEISPAAAPVSGEAFSLGDGAEIVSMALDGDRLALQVKGPQGSEIVVLDLRTGAVVSRVGIGSR